MDFRPKLNPKIAPDFPGAQVYFVPIRGPPGRDGIKGDSIKGDPGRPGADGQKGDPGIQGNPGQNGYNGQNGVKGERGEKGEEGKKGDPGERGPPGVISNDFTEIFFKYGIVEEITSQPKALTQNHMSMGSWGVKYTSDSNKVITVLLLYQNQGVHRVQFQCVNGSIDRIFMLYEGSEIISKDVSGDYIDLPTNIPIQSGTLIRFTIRWKNN